MIPLFLLEKVIVLLEEIEPSEYHESRYDYFEILWALQVKIQKLNLRKAYEKILLAGEHNADHDFCIECPRIKNYPDKSDEDDLPF